MLPGKIGHHPIFRHPAPQPVMALVLIGKHGQINFHKIAGHGIEWIQKPVILIQAAIVSGFKIPGKKHLAPVIGSTGIHMVLVPDKAVQIGSGRVACQKCPEGFKGTDHMGGRIVIRSKNKQPGCRHFMKIDQALGQGMVQTQKIPAVHKLWKLGNRQFL
jgi:hypothetical protein